MGIQPCDARGADIAEFRLGGRGSIGHCESNSVILRGSPHGQAVAWVAQVIAIQLAGRSNSGQVDAT